MSTTFGIKVPTPNEGVVQIVKIAHRYGIGNGQVVVTWLNSLVHILPDEHPVIAIDNTPQGVETLGDLRRLNKKI